MAGFRGGRIDDNAVASRMIKENNKRNDQHKKKDVNRPSHTTKTKAAEIAPKPFGQGGNVNDATGIDTGGLMGKDEQY